ncbi:MAG: electron transfer flavoprotein subunit beta/FixA family protein [Candidatus Obscuribacter sp.]|nr:electron transfer flavoprotein subunit beta/FixA family protein [Candidatus Obscuribacter sp.]HND07181.1 electron transfer flavoprotein subunit beta/FixA family protein [Candidatus Obscuribacter sp.]
MKIAVCVKAVPDTEAKIAIADGKKNIDFNGVRFITSPYDEFAIEEALKLKEKLGGDTTVISMGGNECTDVLRDSLARGIDNAVHLNDADFAGLDTLSTAKVLAAAIKDGGYEIVFVGQQGVGGDNSQVPAMLAELLGFAQTTMVVKFECDGTTFKAEREIEGAHEFVEGTLPAVISAQKGLNEPRYPGIKGVMAARRKEIAVKDASALGVKGQVGGDKLQVTIKEMALPPERPQGRKIEGDPDSAVSELVNLLRSEAHVL